jgi:hypothetical protein
MKKIVFVLTLLLLASPTLARVDITADANGGTVYVYYSMSAGDTNLPRAFGLDLMCSNDANILSVGNFNSDFWVYPGSIDINETTGQVDSNGTPIAVPDGNFPGRELEGPNDGNGMTIEMGSLYVGAPNAPPSSGLLFTFVVDKNCNITISGNTARGKVVLENIDVPDPNYVGTTVLCACPGDLNTSGGDGRINLQDLSATYGILIQAGSDASYICYPGDGCWNECGDLNFDRRINLQDLSAVYGKLIQAGSDAGYTEYTDCQVPMGP